VIAPLVPGLQEWQALLQESILNRVDSLNSYIGLPPLQRRQRLSIYQDAYLLRLAEALGTNYPSLYKILGETSFGKLFLGYLTHYPSKHPSIRWFGSELPGYLRYQSNLDNGPLYSELAAFEWAIRHTIDASNADPATFQLLASVLPDAWPDLNLRLHPACSLLDFEWNIPEFWHSIDHADVHPQPAVLEKSWIVYRGPDGSANWRSLDDLERMAIREIGAGVKFGDLCERIATVINDPEEAPQTAALLLRVLVDDELLILA
jgi:hypothetical protein